MTSFFEERSFFLIVPRNHSKGICFFCGTIVKSNPILITGFFECDAQSIMLKFSSILTLIKTLFCLLSGCINFVYRHLWGGINKLSGVKFREVWEGNEPVMVNLPPCDWAIKTAPSTTTMACEDFMVTAVSQVFQPSTDARTANRSVLITIPFKHVMRN